MSLYAGGGVCGGEGSFSVVGAPSLAERSTGDGLLLGTLEDTLKGTDCLAVSTVIVETGDVLGKKGINFRMKKDWQRKNRDQNQGKDRET